MTDAAAHADEVRDFTVGRKPHPFRIDDDVFTAPAKLAIPTLRKLASMRAGLSSVSAASDIDQTLQLLDEIFRLFLPGADGERFSARLNADGSDPATPPIDLVGEALPLVFWLLEQYGLRPTMPSSASPAGSTDESTATPSDGTSLTDGASPTESPI